MCSTGAGLRWHDCLSLWWKPVSKPTEVCSFPSPCEVISRRRGSGLEIHSRILGSILLVDCMRILLASSEVYPFSKTGGLADMVSALGKALARCGNQVGLVTPLYLGLRERFPGLKPLGLPLEIPLGVRVMRAEVWGLESEKG